MVSKARHATLARSVGGVSDDSVVGDCDGAMNYLKAFYLTATVKSA